MKKNFYVLLIFGFVLYLTACENKNNNLSLQDENTEKVINNNETNENIEDDNQDNLEDMIDEAHKAASYFYFDNTGNDFYDKEIFIKGDRSNEIWYKVTDERFSTRTAAKEYLGNYFSEELVDIIIGQAFRDECIKSKNDELYIAPVEKDTFVSKVESKIKEKTENKIIYSVDVEYFDKLDDDSYKKAMFESGKYGFICEKINGKWLFTKFSYVW